MDTFTKFEQDIVYLQLWAPLKIKILLGFKLEYFVSRFERKLIYLQLWVPLKIVVLGGAQIDNSWRGSKLNIPTQFEKNRF